MVEEPTDAQLPTERLAAANLGWSIGMVLRAWQTEVDEVLRGMPGGSRGYHLLSAVSTGEPQQQKTLAENLAIDRTVLTYLIDDFVDAGLIERRLDPHDRRARRIVATERGRRVLSEAENRVSAVEDRVLAGISPAERRSFREIAAQAATTIHAARPEMNPCDAVESVLDLPA